jgi:SAM-dependent methyltransferase
MWRIRAAGFRTFERRILPLLPAGRLRVADLGAGTGWLANRLASRGHIVDAVDVLDNDWDGLGTHRHYENTFRPVQASFDELPFRQGLFDLIVFNATLHYSLDYSTTLKQVLHAMKPGGALAVIDTPVYRHESSGLEMVAERREAFTTAYGFPSDALPLENFLTYDRLHALAAALGLAMRSWKPRYPLRRRLDPFLRRLRGLREPAAFPVILLTKAPR